MAGNQRLRAGQLNKRVTLEALTRTSDGGGGYTEAWGELGGPGRGKVWARVNALSGSEGYRAQQVQASLSHEVEIRYRPDVTARARVSYGGRYLYVTAVLNPEERNERLRLLCEERQA